MKKLLLGISFCLIAGLLVSPQAALAFDAEYKYIISAMKTKEDADKVTKFIKARPGIMTVDVYLDKNTVIIFFDDEELDDEKMQLRIPLKKAGYRVERFDILYEDPEKRN
jgi:copper chaperone CopZ